MIHTIKYYFKCAFALYSLLSAHNQLIYLSDHFNILHATACMLCSTHSCNLKMQDLYIACILKCLLRLSPFPFYMIISFSSNTSIASMVISAQVMQQEGTSVALQKTPATIKFTFNSSAYNSTVRHLAFPIMLLTNFHTQSAKYSCVFWQSNSNM